MTCPCARIILLFRVTLRSRDFRPGRIRFFKLRNIYLSSNCSHAFEWLSTGLCDSNEHVGQETRLVSTRERLGHVERRQVGRVTTEQLHRVYVNRALLVYGRSTYDSFDRHVLDDVFKVCCTHGVGDDACNHKVRVKFVVRDHFFLRAGEAVNYNGRQLRAIFSKHVDGLFERLALVNQHGQLQLGR